jgi:hypothetical protein
MVTSNVSLSRTSAFQLRLLSLWAHDGTAAIAAKLPVKPRRLTGKNWPIVAGQAKNGIDRYHCIADSELIVPIMALVRLSPVYKNCHSSALYKSAGNDHSCCIYVSLMEMVCRA